MSRRKSSGGGGTIDPTGWMISLADLLTLMLTFFVLLLSMSSLDAKKLQETFGFFQGALGVLEKGEHTGVSVPEPLDVRKSITQMAGEQDTLMDRRVSFANDLRKRMVQLRMEESFPETSVEMSLSPRGIIVSFLDDVLFAEGKATLLPLARSVLQASGEMIRKSHYHVIVEGHVGPELLAGARYASAWDLSLARSAAVLNLLVRDVRFPPHRLAIAAYGGMKPLFPNDTPEHRRRNQRVELVLYEPEEERSASR